MAKLTPQDVLKLAQLARLSLTEDELNAMAPELSSILDMVEKLNEVDVKGLEPTTQVTGLSSVWRDDEVIDYSAEPDELLKNAPATENHQIKVKRVIE